jgi:transglutaminase-like putative cysteine protease
MPIVPVTPITPAMTAPQREPELDRPFRAVILLNVLVGLCGFGLANESLGMLAAVTLLSAVGWYVTEVRARSHAWKGLPRWVTASVLAVLLVVAVARAWALQDLVVAFSEFLGGIIVLKLWERRAVRDYGQLITLSLFMTIGATLTNNSVVIGAVWAVQLPLMIAGVMMFQVYAARERAAAAARVPAQAAPGPRARGAGVQRSAFLRLLVGVLAAGMAISAAVFVVVPRGIGGDEWGAFGIKGGRTTGFSEYVEPGAGDLISSSYSTVLEVALLGPSGALGGHGQYHYLRGTVLEVYDRGVWREPIQAQRSGLNREGRGGQWMRLDDPRGGEWVEQRVSVLGGGRKEISPLFALYKPTAVKIDDVTRPRIKFDLETGRLHRQGSAAQVSYAVRSSVPPPVPEKSERVPPRDQFSSRPVRELAETLLRRADIEPDPQQRPVADDERAARTFMTYLRGFEYATDQLRPPIGLEPTEWFLLTARRGHCEYFASALAGMCRSVGINARVIAGYLANEYDAERGVYVVRESDAHAWVEVDTGPGGWQIMDATPVAMTRTIQQPGGMERVRRFMAGITDFWNARVVTFDARRQESLMGSLGSARLLEKIAIQQRALVQWWREVRRRGEVPVVLGLSVGALALSAGAVWAARRAWNRRGRREWQVGWAMAGPERRVYRALLAALADRGFPKPVWSPPAIYIEEIAAVDPALAERARAVVQAVYAARFGGSAGALTQAESALEALRAR